MLQVSERGGSLVVVVSGDFDARCALAINAVLARRESRRVALEFTRLTSFSRLAVAVLAPAIAGRELELHGVSPAQLLVFRSFGLRASSAEASAA